MVSFANASTKILTAQTSGLSGPSDVAVDSSGNLYIADYFNNRVLKETLANGTYTQSVIPSTQLNAPAGVAVDGSGNVFIADSGNNRVLEETLSQGSYTESTIGSGMNIPFGVSLDAYGNLYVGDSGNNRILLETLSGGSYTQSTLIPYVAQPFGVVVDTAGNLYIAERGMNDVLKETPVSGGYTQSVITSNVVAPYKVMVDGNGTVYVADTYHNRILTETWNSGASSYLESTMIDLSDPMGLAEDASGNIYIASYGYDAIVKVQTTPPNFGALAVNANTPTLFTLTFVFNSAGSIGPPAVLTMGAPGLDFQDANTGTCTTNAVGYSYNPGDVCSEDVNFQPLFPGVRNGAVELQDIFGDPVVTTYITGVGLGADLAFFPPVRTVVTEGQSLDDPVGLALDGNNSVYIASYANSQVLVTQMSNGDYQTPFSIGIDLVNPTGVAVDGAGNVSIAEIFGAQLVEESLANGNYTQNVIVSGLNDPADVAVDGVGNLYVTESNFGTALVETPSSSGYTQSVITHDLTAPYGIAVDGAGNVYIADSSLGQVVKETPSGGTYSESIIASGLSMPSGVALDAAGDVYITNNGHSVVQMLPWDGTTYGSLLNVVTTPYRPNGLAFDAGGNLYLSEGDAAIVLKENFSQTPPLDFGTVGVGQTSSSQTVVVANTGNSTLTFTTISITGNFNLQTDCSTQTPLAPGGTCSLNVTFTPTASAYETGTMEVASTVNPAGTSISLSGTGQAVATRLAFGASIPTPIANGGNLGTVTVNVLDGSGNLVTGSTATVALQITGPAGFTTYNTSTSAVSGVASFNLTTLALTVAGNYTISASSSGLTSAQASFTVSPAAATALAFGATIPSTVTNGGNLGTLTVDVVDGSGGTVTGSAATVALQITGPAGFTTYNASTSAVSGVASFDLTTLALTVAGNYTITASSTGLTSAQASFTVSPPASFGLSPASNTLTVASGASGTVNVTITPTGGFTGDIALSCSNLPAYASCSFSPDSLQADGSNGSLTSVLTISTNASLIASNGRSKVPLVFACWSATGLFGLLLFPAVKRGGKRLSPIAGAVLLLALLIVLPGCGAIRHTTSAQQTPPGTYSVTLNATSGGNTASGVLTLNVN